MVSWARGAMIFVIIAAFCGLGCEGKIAVQGADGIPGFDPDIVDPDNPEVTEPPPGTIVRPPDEVIDNDVCEFIDPGTTPLRRITAEEYNNTVRDLFPFVSIPLQGFAPDERPSGFEANTISAVGDLQIEEYQRAAERISGIVVADLANILAADADESAVRAFIQIYGKRTFRRPLQTEEVDGLYNVYAIGNADFDAATGAEMVIEALLQSPSFLYRPETGVADTADVVLLTDYEVASRLSYFLWGSTPDDLLLSAAESGSLSTAAQVEVQARRMLDDPRARLRVNEVFAQWLHVDELDRVDNPHPAFTEDVKNSMIAENQAFIDDVLWEGEGTVSALLTADYTYVDGNTSSFYGLPGSVASGDGLVRVDLPEGRKGILSQLAIMTAQGRGQMPVHRGKFIRDAFLCVGVSPPSPPDDIVPLPSFEGESQRSKSEKRLAATAEGCAGCHAMMDGIGLAFDNYDSMGRYVTEDEFGNELHSDSVITNTLTTDGPVNGVAELADKLAASPEVQDCISAQFFRYAVARMNTTGDACSLYVVAEALADSGNDVREMFVALARTDAFRYRRNLSAEQ